MRSHPLQLHYMQVLLLPKYHFQEVFHFVDRGNRGYGEGNDGDRGEGSDAGEELSELGFLALGVGNDNNNWSNNQNE